MKFLAQRANFNEFQRAFSGIQDDIFNLSGSFAKLALIEQSRDKVPHGLSRMVTGEVEYLLMVVRSLFDLFQEALSKLWDGVVLFDDNAVHRKLKSSFSDMLSYKGASSNAAEIAERFGLPMNIAGCYERSRGVFEGLKGLRDNIVHNGSQLPNIYGGDGSFMIARRDNPFPAFDVWRESEIQANNLVPLLPILEMLFYKSVSICNDFVSSFQTVIELPPPIVPGMRLFARGYFTGHLVAAMKSGADRTGVVGRQPS